jgi:hypothetical protein
VDVHDHPVRPTGRPHGAEDGPTVSGGRARRARGSPSGR